MTLMNTEMLEKSLKELCEWEALEVIIDKTLVYIPYVMNDAVECYIKLTDCMVQGSWDDDSKEKITFEIVEREGSRNGLLLHQGENVVSIWYQKAYYHLQCFQYHQIGHMWRNRPGEEHIRRLVHLICVIHDKWNYLGEKACNEKELKLALLAEFAPLRYWTPINDSILPWYPETAEGIEEFQKLIKEAEDQTLYLEVQKYKQAFDKDKITEGLVEKLARKIAEPERFAIYKLLEERVKEASLLWPARTYTEEAQQKKIDWQRKSAEDEYRNAGYSGKYPVMYRENEEVFFVEEQPFTIMEADEYYFKIMELKIQHDKKNGRFLKKNRLNISMKKRG